MNSAGKGSGGGASWRRGCGVRQKPGQGQGMLRQKEGSKNDSGAGAGGGLQLEASTSRQPRRKRRHCEHDPPLTRHHTPTSWLPDVWGVQRGGPPDVKLPALWGEVGRALQPQRAQHALSRVEMEPAGQQVQHTASKFGRYHTHAPAKGSLIRPSGCCPLLAAGCHPLAAPCRHTSEQQMTPPHPPGALDTRAARRRAPNAQ